MLLRWFILDFSVYRPWFSKKGRQHRVLWPVYTCIYWCMPIGDSSLSTRSMKCSRTIACTKAKKTHKHTQNDDVSYQQQLQTIRTDQVTCLSIGNKACWTFSKSVIQLFTTAFFIISIMSSYSQDEETLAFLPVWVYFKSQMRQRTRIYEIPESQWTH